MCYYVTVRNDRAAGLSPDGRLCFSPSTLSGGESPLAGLSLRPHFHGGVVFNNQNCGGCHAGVGCSVLFVRSLEACA